MAVLLTLLMVVGLLVMVFPLRIVYAFGAADLSGGRVPSPFELDPLLWAEQLTVIFAVYGASWAWLAGVVVAMFAYALAQRHALALNRRERANAMRHLWVFGFIALSGISSIVMVLTVPDHLLPLAGYQYFILLLLPVVAIFLRAVERRRGTDDS